MELYRAPRINDKLVFIKNCLLCRFQYLIEVFFFHFSSSSLYFECNVPLFRVLVHVHTERVHKKEWEREEKKTWTKHIHNSINRCVKSILKFIYHLSQFLLRQPVFPGIHKHWIVISSVNASAVAVAFIFGSRQQNSGRQLVAYFEIEIIDRTVSIRLHFQISRKIAALKRVHFFFLFCSPLASLYQ